jgi:outer membrane protein assembly factor BamB
MAADLAPLAPARRFAWVRLLLAWAVTFAVLPYGYGRFLVFALQGAVDKRLAAIVAATVAGLLVLTWKLRPPLKGVGLLVAWAAVLGGLLVWSAAPQMPLWQLAAVFIPATVWVVWLAWLGAWPLRWPARLGMLAVWMGLGVLAPLVVRVEGMAGETTTGSPRLVFAWRTPRPKEFDAPAAAARADVTPTPDDFPRFLGPDANGVLPNARVSGDWKSAPPREVWRRPVGSGWGGFVVVGGAAITQEQRGDGECVTCYRLADGEPVWVHADAARFAGMGGVGPCATPAVAGGKVYAVGGTGLLNCLDAATGRRLWSVNILEDNGADLATHGVCGSPLVDGDRVLVCPTGRGGPSLAAYHKDTGSKLWATGTDRASYASPMIADLGGVRQVLLATAVGVTGHDTADGRVLWRFEWANSERINAAQPIPNAGGPGQVLISTGYGKGAALFPVHGGPGTAEWEAGEAVWTSLSMKTKFTTPVLYDGHVYGLDDGILACIDPATGRRKWKDGRYGHGQILLAGDRLMVQAESGAVILVEPSPQRLIERGRIAALSSKTWNNPALAGRYLLVRNDREAACYELPPPQQGKAE